MEIVMRYPNGRAKALTLSYDDGCQTDKRLIDIMTKNKLKGTFNIMSMLFDLPEAHVKERMRVVKQACLESGNEVACHGYDHPALSRMIKTGIIQQVMEDRRRLEREFGTVVRGMAYPYGDYDDTVIEILKMCGVCYSRVCACTNDFRLPKNWYEWKPTCHHDADLMQLADRFLTREVDDRDDPILFYVWGHTYEFDQKNNWNHIEEFAEKIGNRDDVWYCTNIEFYDYVQCFNNLQFSVDENIIHNPTATDVWVTLFENKKTVVIPAGKTVFCE